MRLLFIDGNNIAMRSFYANEHLVDQEGQAVGAIFGCLRTLFKIASELRPARVFWFWDGGRSEYRQKLYPDYKKRRRETDELRMDCFREQVSRLKDYLSLLGVVQLCQKGQEADDLIYYARKLLEDDEVFIASADRDFLQMIDERTKIYNLGDNKVLDLHRFRTNYSLQPQQWPLVRAISGDSSDNIKGVCGFGDKRSLQIVQLTHTLEGLYDAHIYLTDRLAKILVASMEIIYRNLDLIDLSEFPEDLIDRENLLQQIYDGLGLQMQREAFWRVCRRHDFTTIIAENFEWGHVYGG